MINIVAAWIGFLMGAVSGAIPGLFFQNPDWLGGYTSWPRRLIRLGHISFFGIGFLNLGLGLTGNLLGVESSAASVLMLVGAAAMPAVCYASAFRPAFRHLFFIPAGSVVLSIALFIVSVDGASSSVLEEPRDLASPFNSLNTQPVSFNPMELEAPSTQTERMVQL